MKSYWTVLLRWFESRLGLRQTVGPILGHPVPPGAGWWYVFGSASMTLLLVQMFTGVCLALVYVPAADKAYESLEYLNYTQELGWFLRAMHFWAGSGMVVMVVLHMTQVFLFGAFKYPRELTWMVGVVLFALTLAMGFSGQVLRWDQDAYWGVGVGAAMAGRVPFVGDAIVHLLLGGPTIGGETLSRFFTLHVFVLPGLLLATLGLHLYLVLRLGISEPPVPGETAEPGEYERRYHKLLQRGEPFFPDSVYRDAIYSAVVVTVVVVLAAWLGPYGPSEPPDPTIIDAEPRPEWYFLPLFALLSLSPPQLETFIMLGLPVVGLVALFLVPVLFGRGERAPGRRPLAVLAVIFLYVTIGVLGWLGYKAPWSPVMDAWSGVPVPISMVKGRGPLELAGAIVLQNKDCRNCHALEGKGGRRGPQLDGVAARLSRTELIRQVLQGGGNMPAYGRELTPAEVEAVVAFLETLHGPDQPVARLAFPLTPGRGDDPGARTSDQRAPSVAPPPRIEPETPPAARAASKAPAPVKAPPAASKAAGKGS